MPGTMSLVMVNSPLMFVSIKIVFHIILQLVAIPEGSCTVHNIEKPLLYILLFGQYLVMVSKADSKKGL